jgi:glycerophosphoryl diester phosphodiesterase
MPRILRVALVAVLIAVALSSASMLDTTTTRSCPALVAHRGDIWPYSGSTQPENSLGAFALAFKVGAPTVKADLEFSAPGRNGVDPAGAPVIIHDPTVNRTTLYTGNVNHYSAAALTRMRLLEKTGIRSSVTRQTIPSLSTALAAIKADHGRVMFELHGLVNAAQMKEVAAKLVQSGAYRSDGSVGPATWVSFNSFVPPDLVLLRAAVAATGHTLTTQFLAWSYTATVPAGSSMEDVDYRHGIPGSGPPLSAANVAAIHAAGMLAGSFAPDLPTSNWAALAAKGVDQITTDDPARYVAWCEARG